MSRFIGVLLCAAVLLGAVSLWWFKWDGGLPGADLEGDSGVVGRNAAWVIRVRAPGRAGLESVLVRLISGDRTFPIADRTFPARGWGGSGVDEVRIPVEIDIAALGVPEGVATLEVLAETHGWRMFARDKPVAGRFPQTVDSTPPRAQVLSDQHNTRIGGSAAAVFRVGDDATAAEVRVATYRFPVLRDFFQDGSLALGIFAIPENLTPDVRPVLWATDAAGNEVELQIPCTIRPREFRERALEIDDDFLRRKIPQIYATRGLAPPSDLLEGFLVVNRDIRTASEEILRKRTATSQPRPLWTGAFLRMARAQTMSEFGDRRAYSYGGRIVDRQTHLGVDLASLQGAEVEASQDGIVVFAGDLGIYGQTVVLDHGLHVFTLYGHLSSVLVKEGERVAAGSTLGLSGQTGLAGGDHLHFSIMVHGHHVDPVEWWDPKWVRERIAAKFDLFPRADDPPTEDSDDQKVP